MPRYLIEHSHDNGHYGCVRFLNSLRQAGAHVLANAEFGCDDGVHTAWLIVEAEDDHYARLMVPPLLRDSALLVRLNRFTPDQINVMHQQIEAE